MTLTTAYVCVLIAALLPYLWVAVSKASGERYDNRDPRRWQERQQSPRAQRAYNAQLNSYEAFAPFAAGVVLAQLAGVPHSQIATLSLAFVTLRVAMDWCTSQAATICVHWCGRWASPA